MIRLGVVMDPIDGVYYHKDSTLALLWEAQSRGWQLYYFEQKSLFLRNGASFGQARLLEVMRNPTQWFCFHKDVSIPLADLDVILMRKDPPVDEEYIYTTYILERAEQQGVCVINKPQALRDANEKIYASLFPQCSPPTLVSRSIKELRHFWQEHQDIVCKPLNSMGGQSIFRLQKKEANATVIFEMLTRQETRHILAQRFIPEIVQGDKRILMINGEAVPYALARIPHPEDWRGNLAAGASGKVQPLSERDQWICSQVGPELRKRGLFFAGIDVIGDFLTEINVTSPTCIREIDAATESNISARLLDCVEGQL